VVWAQPLKQIDPDNPLDPPFPFPDYESREDYLARAGAFYDFYDQQAASRSHTPAYRRRTLAQHADWYVLHVVAKRPIAEIAADPELFGRKTGNISTITKGIDQFRKLLHGK